MASQCATWGCFEPAVATAYFDGGSADRCGKCFVESLAAGCRREPFVTVTLSDAGRHVLVTVEANGSLSDRDVARLVYEAVNSAGGVVSALSAEMVGV